MTEAPVLYLIGHGFRPAHMPADYIGPRLDCPMWMPTPDADIAYDGGKFDPFDVLPGYAWGTWLPATPPACCIETGPYTPLPSVETVPVPASAGLLIAAVLVLAAMRRRG